MKLAVAILGLAILVKAQDRPTFRTDVSQVHVDVEVVSKEGRIVSGLGKSDFRVFDEGQEQTVVGFASEEQPLDVILLFDISDSMRKKLAWVTAAAGQALKELKHGPAECAFPLRTGDGAIYFLEQGPAQRRRAILLITDNMGLKTRNEMGVVHDLWEADTVLCGLKLRDPGYPTRRAIATVFALMRC